MSGFPTVRWQGERVEGFLSDAVTEISVDLGVAESSQVVLTVSDPGLRLLAAGVLARGALVTVGDSQWRVSVVETVSGSDPEQVRVTARDPLAWGLRRDKRSVVASNLPVGLVVGADVIRLGGRLLGPPSPTAGSFTSRGFGDDGRLESAWDMARRLAADIDWWFWTTGTGDAWLAPATWLAERANVTRLTWRTGAASDLPVLPGFRVSDDDEDTDGRVTVTLPVASCVDLRPGLDVLELMVPGEWSGRQYLVEQVQYRLSEPDDGTVTAVVPKAPQPRPGT